MRSLIFISALLACTGGVLADDLSQQLQNPQHLKEVQDRLQNFYQVDLTQTEATQVQQQLRQSMNQKPTKYSAQTGKPRESKLQQKFSLQNQLQEVQRQLKDVQQEGPRQKLQAQQQELEQLIELAKKNPLVQSGQAKVSSQFAHQQVQTIASKQKIAGLQEAIQQQQDQIKQTQQQAQQEKDDTKKKQLQQQQQKQEKQQQQLVKQLEKVKKLQLPEGRAAIEGNDKIEDLLASYMDDDEVIRDMNVISKSYMSGKADIMAWSDDYWALTNGTTSYRYATERNFSNYMDAVTSYLQPDRWVKNATEDSGVWSPAEKYDITVGDVGNGSATLGSVKGLDDFSKVPGFTLTRMQKNEGMQYWNDSHKVEDWMGICHGWAPAAVFVPRPESKVTVKGAKNTEVTWWPSDIRAISSLAWANGNSATNFIGGRCNEKNVVLLKNGRIAHQDCFDNNPATWHLALVNFLGHLKQAFVGDGTFDYEVWNNPIVKYQFTYFNPLNPKDTNKDWNAVKVKYDDPDFAKKDRFRLGGPKAPTYTRGKKGRGSVEKQIKYVVGVVATVNWIAEVDPHKGEPNPDQFNVVTYTYDLELSEHNGVVEPIGGEWHENQHPDFLWMPRKNSKARSNFDSVALNYNGVANEATAKQAQKASQESYPLYQVLRFLVNKSKEADNRVY